MPDQPDQNAPPLVVVSDGCVYTDYLALCGKDMAWLAEIAASRRTEIRDILLMTLDRTGNYHMVKREGAL